MVLPVTGCAPPVTTDPEVAEIYGDRFGLRSVVLPNTVAANIAGVPAITVPASSEGIEYGVQLMGPAGSDLTLVQLAEFFMNDSADQGGTGPHP